MCKYESFNTHHLGSNSQWLCSGFVWLVFRNCSVVCQGLKIASVKSVHRGQYTLATVH
jgi:hypothetical protein